MVDDNNNDLFSEYRRLFLSELERLERARDKHEGKIQDLEKEQAVLKTKAMFIGTIAGAVMSGVISFAVKYLG